MHRHLLLESHRQQHDAGDFTDAPIPVLNNSIVVSADGTKATLLRDVTITETITVDKEVTLDLNGHSIMEGQTVATPNGGPFLFKIDTAEDVMIKNSGNSAKITATDSGLNVSKGKVTVDSGVTIDAKYAGIYLRGSTETIATNYAVVTVNKDAVVTGLELSSVELDAPPI
ncbi:MAG: hypothetical protein MJ014_00635 [Methanocorpusculum sp.]|nr:hypothetical protein [Methanocorpusculum sp.]